MAPSIETVAVGPAGGGRDRIHTAQGSECSFRPQSFWIASCGDQEGGCRVGSDTKEFHQSWSRLCGEAQQLVIYAFNLRGELAMTTGQYPQGVLCCPFWCR